MLATAAVLLALAPVRSTAAARLVADLRTEPDVRNVTNTAAPSGFTAVGTRIFFSARFPDNGREPWVTDGSEAGTHLVRDVAPGPDGSNPGPFVAVGDEIFFTADDGSRGIQVWKSDGTATGTVALDLGSSTSQVPHDLTAFGGALYFTTSGYGGGLWRSDGTQAGTTQLVALGDGRIVPTSDRLYVVTDSSVWTSDGTQAGTQRVASGFQVTDAPVVANGSILYFCVQGTNFNDTLWKSDGTAAGTYRVVDTFAGVGQAYIWSITPFGSDLLLDVYDGVGSVESLWHLSTVAYQRQQLSKTAGREVAVLAGTAYFVRSDPATGAELWATDGTYAGTRMVADINAGTASSSPAEFTVFDGVLFFAATDGLGSRELWTTDGTPEGTQRFVYSCPGYCNTSNPQDLAVANGTLYFSADDGMSGPEPWKSDGSAAGTALVADIWPEVGSSSPDELTELDGALLFKALGNPYASYDGSAIWRSDGTGAGTQMLRELQNSSGYAFEALAGQVFFVSTADSNHGRLWKSDGTATGTSLAAEPVVVYPSPVEVNGAVVFAAGDGSSGELWRLGESSGSGVLLGSFTRLNLYSRSMRVLNGQALFPADDGSGAGEVLWASDGAASGTHMLKDVRGPRSSFRGSSAVFHDRYLFAAYDPATGTELWQSDGTEAGTQLLTDLAPGTNSSSPDSLTVVGDRLFFATSSPPGLWVTDGTPDGATVLLDPLRSTSEYELGMGWSRTRAVVGDRFFFTHDDGTHGYELWVSNGTPAGTLLVRDIEPGPGSSLPEAMQDVGGRLVFRACTGGEGCELWVSDGTAGGTRRLEDLYPGPTSSYPGRPVAVGGALFFAARSPAVGRELFAFDLGTCGDGSRGPLEECDDGNLASGDGCSASCDLESSWTLGGTALGGAVSVSVEGVPLTLATQPGQGADEVLAALVAAIQGDPALDARGISASVQGSTLITTGDLASIEIDDPGLYAPPAIPALGPTAAAWLGAMLLVLGGLVGGRLAKARGARP